MNDIIKDGGVKSRKLWFSVFSVAVIAITGILFAWLDWPFIVYEALVAGVSGIAGLYLAGNVTQKFIGSKVAIAAQKKAGKPAPTLTLAEDPAEEPGQPPAQRFAEE